MLLKSSSLVMLGLQKLCPLTTFLPQIWRKLCMVANISIAQATNFEVISTLYESDFNETGRP